MIKLIEIGKGINYDTAQALVYGVFYKNEIIFDFLHKMLIEFTFIFSGVLRFEHDYSMF